MTGRHLKYMACGQYSAFSFANKELSIIGDDAATVIVYQTEPVTIGPLQPGQPLLMTDMTFCGAGVG